MLNDDAVDKSSSEESFSFLFFFFLPSAAPTTTTDRASTPAATPLQHCIRGQRQCQKLAHPFGPLADHAERLDLPSHHLPAWDDEFGVPLLALDIEPSPTRLTRHNISSTRAGMEGNLWLDPDADGLQRHH